MFTLTLNLCSSNGSVCFDQSGAVTGGFAQASFGGVGAAVNCLEADGANADIGFASEREFFPITRTFTGFERFTTEDLCHARSWREIGVRQTPACIR